MKKTIGKFLMLTALAGTISSGFAMKTTEEFANSSVNDLAKYGVAVNNYGALIFSPLYSVLEEKEGSNWVQKGYVTDAKTFDEVSKQMLGKKEEQLTRRIVQNPTTIFDILLEKQKNNVIQTNLNKANDEFNDLMGNAINDQEPENTANGLCYSFEANSAESDRNFLDFVFNLPDNMTDKVEFDGRVGQLFCDTRKTKIDGGQDEDDVYAVTDRIYEKAVEISKLEGEKKGLKNIANLVFKDLNAIATELAKINNDNVKIIEGEKFRGIANDINVVKAENTSLKAQLEEAKSRPVEKVEVPSSSRRNRGASSLKQQPEEIKTVQAPQGTSRRRGAEEKPTPKTEQAPKIEQAPQGTSRRRGQ